MKRVILTGGTGMLGIALMEFLIQKEIEVLVIIRPGSKRRDGIPKSPWIHVLECDLADLRSLEGTLEGYDTFFHLPGMAPMEKPEMICICRIRMSGRYWMPYIWQNPPDAGPFWEPVHRQSMAEWTA